MSFPDYKVARERMVRDEIVKREIADVRVQNAMLNTPRHLFLGEQAGPEAYSSHAFPIGYSQTISQPYMVAYLAEQLELTGAEKVLELGTGSGYQAAVLAQLASSVCTIERIPELATKAQFTLETLGISAVTVRTGDGSLGWPGEAPFDRILLTAAAEEIPQTLIEQLTPNGFLLGPVVRDRDAQEIVKLVRTTNGCEVHRLKTCSFVPLIRGERPEHDAQLDTSCS